MVQLPAVVVDFTTGPAKCVPPVMLMFGLCPPRQDAAKDRPS
jgi:hypothetical protein